MTHSVKDIQDRFGVSQATVLHWISSGQLKSLNVGRDPGKLRARHRITEEAIREFELTRSSRSPVPQSRRKRKQSNDVIEFIK